MLQKRSWKHRMSWTGRLPAEYRMGMTDVQIVEMGAVIISSHKGLLSFSEKNAIVAIHNGVLEVRGLELELESMTMAEIRLRGTITAVERRA